MTARRRRRPGAQMDPEADRLILEAAKQLLHEVGYARLTIDAVAQAAGVARTTVYRRYRDKADLVAAAIDSLRQPLPRAPSGDVREELIAHLDAARRGFDMSLAGTLLMEAPHNPALMELFRERMIEPRRDVLRELLERGISEGQLRRETDIDRTIDLFFGALFFATLSGGRPSRSWSVETVDALWPALAATRAA